MSESVPSDPEPERPAAREHDLDIARRMESLSRSLPDREVLGGTAALIRHVGSVCWAIVGVVVVIVIVLSALAVVSEVVLPLVFGVVLAVVFTPLCQRLQRRGWRPALAALAIVVALIAVVVGAVLLAVTAVVQQTGEWSAQLDVAINEVTDYAESIGIDVDDLQEARRGVAGASAFIKQGMLTVLVSGVGTVIGFLAGVVLAVLILYYLLKDTDTARARLVGLFSTRAQPEVDALASRSARTIRSYGAGRTVLSAAVAVIITLWSAILGLPMLLAIFVVNFFGGYIPYLGAIIGGFVAVVLALAELGVPAAVLTLVVVLLANLGLENFVEPRVMGNRLHIHPLAVLLVTTAGGIVGGVVGLILAVPLYVVAVDAVTTFRRRLEDATVK
jgi:predicted PurR-regulated permease PerM